MLNSQAAMASAYKSQQVMTASPEQLTLLLYNGALRFLNESIQAMEESDLQKSHNANMRVQAIISELVVTLDTNYEFYAHWAALYEYIEHCLIEGNIRKDVGQLNNAKVILEGMRGTWQEAMKLAQQAKAAGV